MSPGLAIAPAQSFAGLHATMQHLPGLDHERLSYRYSSRDNHLTDVAGEVMKGIIA